MSVKKASKASATMAFCAILRVVCENLKEENKKG